MDNKFIWEIMGAKINDALNHHLNHLNCARHRRHRCHYHHCMKVPNARVLKAGVLDAQVPDE